jgi:capsular polysaccharide biosynthesis protein
VLEVEIPPAFIAGIPGGHVVGEHGVVVTPDGNLLLDVSGRIGALHVYVRGDRGRIPDPAALSREWALPPRRLEGTVAVLSTFAGRGFYHWLFDVLPRIGLLRDAGYDVDRIDAFIVPIFAARYQIETLAALGIPRNKIISSYRDRHLKVEQLLVPSLPREKAIIPSWVCDFIRSSFPPKEPASFDPADKIYIVRKQTDHGRVPNEDELAERLEEIGFKSIAMEEFTLSEKAWILSKVNTIVSPGGAGLSNIVFANPGTTVLELQTRSFPQMDAWDLANRMRLNHFFVLPSESARKVVREAAKYGDAIRAADVLETLELAGCLESS